MRLAPRCVAAGSPAANLPGMTLIRRLILAFALIAGLDSAPLAPTATGGQRGPVTMPRPDMKEAATETRGSNAKAPR
jgi:hypothetical protein